MHDDVCRHLLEHRCNTVLQMREAVSLLVQMQADSVPCRVEADPTQAFVHAEVGTVVVMYLAPCWCKCHSRWRLRAWGSHWWATAVPDKGSCSLQADMLSDEDKDETEDAHAPCHSVVSGMPVSMCS